MRFMNQEISIAKTKPRSLLRMKAFQGMFTVCIVIGVLNVLL